MTTFKEIRGNLIKSTSTDPANPQDGQIWYNSTSQVLKGEEFLEAWSSGGTMNDGRGQVSGLGTQTAGLAAGTQSTPPPQSATEAYDGTTWTTVNSLNDGRADLNMFGIQTAGIAAAGDDFPASPRGTLATESWDGTNWTSVNNTVNGSFENHAACGIQTAGFIVGGRTTPTNPSTTSATQDWDGTNWTSGVSYPANIQGSFVFGTQTACISASGSPSGPDFTGDSYSFDGSTWTSITAVNTTRAYGGNSGIQTSGLIFGGAGPTVPPTARVTTESWDGSTWSNKPDMANSRTSFADGTNGSSSSTFAAGTTPGATEEFTAAPATRTFTTS